MFYTFRQNNSGGSFDFDLEKGISKYVIVEAQTEDEALSRATDIGLYFDGAGDCPCCGDRWSADPDCNDVPTVYDAAVEPYSTLPAAEIKWLRGPGGFIHYADGSIEPFWFRYI